jgi:hypothetical protein
MFPIQGDLLFLYSLKQKTVRFLEKITPLLHFLKTTSSWLNRQKTFSPRRRSLALLDDA